jgi:putative transposase
MAGYEGGFMAAYTPEIFITDQGNQFTSDDFTGILKDHGIKISVEDKGRWIDNVFIERPWRGVKYQDIYLKAYRSIGEPKKQD